MKRAVIAFTTDGICVAEHLISTNTADVVYEGYYKSNHSRETALLPVADPLTDWVKERWHSCDALIFIGACGIAVRAIAPSVFDKRTDPAVLVIDDKAQYCISLLSGHVGGANDLAHEIAEEIGCEPVITTSTDSHDVFAIDVHEKKNGRMLTERIQAKEISAALLAGDPCLSLGIGCRRGADPAAIEQAVCEVLSAHRIPIQSVRTIASIDLKKDEPALCLLAQKLGVPFKTYPAEELQKIEGSHSTSVFVEQKVGVDNVCERSAIMASGGGTLLLEKQIYNHVTVAVAAQKMGERE